VNDESQAKSGRSANNALVTSIVMVALLGSVGILVGWKFLTAPDEAGQSPRNTGPVPVEVSPVRVEEIRDRRVFSGSLEASAESTVAPKVAGRIVSMPIDLADTVERGQLIARLEDAEFGQLVVQAQADLAVAEANVRRAVTTAELAAAQLDRIRNLFGSGDAPQSELDEAEAAEAEASAAVQLARAQKDRANASLRAAEIRLGYTEIAAYWEGGDNTRAVSRLWAEVGDTVGPNTPLATILELDPIEAVFYVTEVDYAKLSVGQQVSLRTDAFPGREWSGEIARIAPAFVESSRQARVEVVVPNQDQSLKPGMFARIDATLQTKPDVTVVPASALVERGGQSVLFRVSESGGTAEMVPVVPGIRDGERLEVEPADPRETLDGRVITLGQHLLDDGSEISVPEDEPTFAAGPEAGQPG